MPNVNNYLIKLHKETIRSRQFFYEMLVASIAIILGILGQYNLAAAVTTQYLLIITTFFYAIYFIIKNKKPISTTLLAILMFLFLLGFHFYILHQILISFFTEQITNYLIPFIALSALIIIREVQHHSKMNSLYKYEAPDGGNTGFFIYAPLWVITAINMLTEIDISNSLFLLIIFVILSGYINALTKIDEENRLKKMNNNTEYSQNERIK